MPKPKYLLGDTETDGRVKPVRFFRGWHESRLIAIERRIKALDKHASWEATFDRWGPAQDRAYRTEKAILQERYEALDQRLAVSRV